MASIRNGVKAAITALGRSRAGYGLLRLGALAPAQLKGPLYRRLFIGMANGTPVDALITTNMGLPGKLRVAVPAGKAHYLYARTTDVVEERSTIELVVRLSADTDAFCDVGANEGIFSFAVAQSCSTSLHLFEPDPNVHRRLASNLARNGINARVNQVALGAEKGRQVFYRNLDDDHSGSLSDLFKDKHRTEAVEMQVETLADYLAEAGLQRAGVKIDVEGAAIDVWSGAIPGLDRIAWIVCEMITPEIEVNLPGQIIERGFHCYYIRDYDLLVSERGEWTPQAPFWNWFFTRDDPDTLARRLAGTRFRVLPQDSSAIPPREQPREIKAS